MYAFKNQLWCTLSVLIFISLTILRFWVILNTYIKKRNIIFMSVLFNLFSSSLWNCPLEGKWQKCFISMFTSVRFPIVKGKVTGWAMPFVKFVKEWVRSTLRCKLLLSCPWNNLFIYVYCYWMTHTTIDFSINTMCIGYISIKSMIFKLKY